MSTTATSPASTDADLQALSDKLEIIELVGLERLWRDTGEWDKLAAAFTEDAVIKTTWFDGNARAFVELSREMADRGRHSKHPINPIYVRINRDRALVESRAEIQNRSEIDGVWVDMTQYVRFISRVRRTPEGWRLASFEGIYEKGTLAPVNPLDRLPFDWSEVERSVPRPAYQLWAWAMTRRGYKVPDNLLGDDRPEELRAFYAREAQWLEGGGDK
ncbi:MAG TPA: nuclear transport factor 2 family protein [Solirubrobacteraceae bacterium]|jgi:hypothetical protein|nr:nuclear transport factor 2 family protein [Solirubrobacteraceae bacterium]